MDKESHLGIHIRVDTQENFNLLPGVLAGFNNLSKVKFTVDINEHTILRCKFQLFQKLSISIENTPAQRDGNVRPATIFRQ